jgi:hypothetical protein
VRAVVGLVRKPRISESLVMAGLVLSLAMIERFLCAIPATIDSIRSAKLGFIPMSGRL